MKIIQRLLLITTYLLFALHLYSQRVEPWKNPDFGPDSISRMECAHDLSTMSEFMKINLPDHALPSWRRVFNNCPASSRNIYLYGVRIYSDKIENSDDEVKKSAYFDTLMIIYDKRIEYFGEEGRVLGRKGMDILKYKGESSYEEAYITFKKSVILIQEESETNVLIGLSETGYAMLMSDKINIGEFLSDYILITGILDKQLQNSRLRNRATMAAERVEYTLSRVNIDDCEEIENAFKTRFLSNPEEENTLLTINKLLRNAGCEKNDFYRDVQLNLLKITPSADIAAEVAKHFIRNDKYPEALDYLLKSLELETSSEKKAQYALQIAVIYCSRVTNYKSAAEYAIKASELNPGWGEPYFALAHAYIEGIKECTDDPFERSAIYWLAVDVMEEARKSDPSVADRAANNIQEYSRYFPSKEECFFRSLNEGSTFHFGCWINRTIRVKTN